ncbi:MAG: ABC transporter permease [Halobacteriota archaeon]
MRKTFIVAKHEFLATVKTKGFIFSLILPLLILLPMVFAMGFIPQTISETPHNIGFVDETGMLQTSDNFIKFGDIGNAKKALLRNEINSFFVLPANYFETGKISVYSKGGFFSSRPTSSIEAFLMDNLLRESNLDETLKERIKEPANEEVITLNEKGEVEEKSGVGFLGVGFLIPYALGILLMIAIMSSSQYLMQGIVAEKENKTVEILLSSLSANELLSGKILGFGSAGLLQVLVWFCSIGIILFLGPFASLFQGIQISWILILAIVYFILGYLLFAGSMACAAAPASTVRDAQQGAMIFTMLGILPMILLSIIVNAPNSGIAKVLTYIPYTTSVTMLMRIALVEVPIYEIAASLLILAISVLIMTKLSAKIFRTGILMYGKKMKIKDVFRYLREK